MNKNVIIGIVAVILVVGGVAFAMNMNKSASNDSTNGDNAMMADDNGMMEGDNQDGVMVGGALMTPDKDIVDNAVNSADHTTLVSAVQAADLVDTLKGPGPFTVFAPTNAAFEKLPEGTVETLLKPENKEQLQGVLTYHVVPGAYRASDLTDGMTLETVNGETITISEKDGAWYINDSAKIEISDAISSNGVTHVIDSVLLPSY